MNKEQANSSNSQGSIRNYIYLFLFFVIALVAVNFMFQYGVDGNFVQRSWGMNNISYYPIYTQLIVLFVMLRVVVPSTNKKLLAFFEEYAGKLDRKPYSRKFKMLFFILISLTFCILLYNFKIKYALLGDEDRRVKDALNGNYLFDEYLTLFILHYLNIGLHTFLHFTPHQTFVFHSIASGFFYSFLGLLISDILFSNSNYKTLFYLFYVSAGITLVFAGYIEIYAFPALSVSFYIYSCIRYIKGKANLLLPLMALLLAIALHLEQVSLIPSLIFIFSRKYKWVDSVNVILLAVITLFAIPLLYLIGGLLHTRTPLLVPFSAPADHPNVYTLLSFTHFREFFNSQFLSSGIIVLLFPITVFIVALYKIKLDSISRFFLIISLFSLVLVFTSNTALGSADWDICSFPSISLIMFVTYTLLTSFGGIYSTNKIKYILTVAVVFNVFNCILWIGINAGDKSVSKIKDMLLTDPGYFYIVDQPAELQLAYAFYQNGLKQESDQMATLGADKYGRTNPRAIYDKLVMQINNKDLFGAITTNEELVKRFPLAYNGIQQLTMLYDQAHLYNKQYKLGIFIEDIYIKDPTNTTKALGQDYLKSFFQYVEQEAEKRKDSAVSVKSVTLLNAF